MSFVNADVLRSFTFVPDLSQCVCIISTEPGHEDGIKGRCNCRLPCSSREGKNASDGISRPQA